MESLKDFASKSFVDQMLLLDEVERGGDPSAIEDLVSLLSDSSTDASLRQAISDTLRAVLRKNPGEVSRCLALGPGTARHIAVRLAGELNLAEAAARLAELAGTASGEEVLDVYSSLSMVAGKDAIGVFRKGALHPEPLISALCIQALAELGDASSLPLLARILSESDAAGRYDICAVPTQAAIAALGKLDAPEAVECLVRKIHHRNPTARRLIHAELVGKGPAVIDRLARFFAEGTSDEQIMAANIIGFVGHPRGVDVLLGAMDKGEVKNPNVRFAILEALGRIPSLKGMVCLVDALGDQDDMILVAVATGLNLCVNPGVTQKTAALLAARNAQSAKIARAVASAGAADLFSALYEDSAAAGVLMEALRTIRDADTLDVFRQALEKIGSDRARSDLALFSQAAAPAPARRVLAVDDSKSVLLFYKTIVADLGFDVHTAGNGREALDILSLDPAFDLIITDLNMPEMDGIELTRKIRENILMAELPIIMATTESEGSQVEIAKSAGVNGFMSKPITPPKIEAMLKEVLG